MRKYWQWLDAGRTTRADLAEKARMLRDHGMSPERRYWHPVLGYNYRMTNTQAGLGVAQLERVDEILAAKRRNARLYAEMLSNVPGLTPQGPPHEQRASIGYIACW